MHPASAASLLVVWMVGAFYLLFFGFFLLVGVGGTILWIAALISCIKHESSTGNDKIVWLLVILFLHVIGAAVYFLVRRPQRIRELGR